MESQSTENSVPVDDGFSEYTVNSGSKRKKTSKVWNELTEGVNESGEKVAICTYCGLKLIAGPSKGTSHLKRHLERCPKRPEGLVIGGNCEINQEFVFDMHELRKAIVLFVVEGGHAFSIVEENSFRRMMYIATPHFVPFSRRTATRDLFMFYVSHKHKLMNTLALSPERICFTTDNWNSSHSWQHYICITAHFVDSEWKLQKRILRFRALGPPYDGESIANEIYMFLCQWHLERRVLTFTVGNASYNDSMINHLRGRLLQRGTLVGNGCFLHIRCCAHIVNLIVKSGLDSIKSILDKIRVLVKSIKNSSKRSKDFYETADKMCHLETRRKLSLDMEVRWNSTYKMLYNMFYYKEVFLYVGSSNSSFKAFVPTEDEWYKLNVIHKFLKVFYEVTCMFSSVKEPTSNVYFKGACMIHVRLLEALDSPDDFLVDIVRPMMKKFNKYWSEYNVHLSCAAILDPRFKVDFVEYSFTKNFGVEEAVRRVDNILDTLKALYDEYKTSLGVSALSPPAPRVEQDNLFEDYSSFRGTRSRRVTRRSQLELYLEEDPLGLTLELDVLEYWHQNSVRFPVLFNLARDILTIPVSSVASESAFSVGGKTISPARSSLASKTIQALVCVQDWRRAEDDSSSQFDLLEEGDSDDDIDEEDDNLGLFE